MTRRGIFIGASILIIIIAIYIGTPATFSGAALVICLNIYKITRPITGGGPAKRTYILDANKSIFHWDRYKDYLRGWKQLKPGAPTADFIFCLSGGSRANYGTRAVLKARLDSLEITDKAAFHAHAAQICPKYIAKTVEVGPDTEMPRGAVWMVRANWGWKGRASSVATTTAELQALYRKYSVLPGDWRKPTKPRVIASEYIRDPYLWNGYKFHARAHIIAVVLGNGRRYAALLKTIEVIPAGKPFVNASYTDADIHDTHDERNPLIATLDDAELRENLVAALRASIVPMLPLLRQYPEAQNSYDMWGADVMFRADKSAVIIEINSTPGLVEDKNDPRLFENDEMANAIFATAFSDVFEAAGDNFPLTYL